MEHRTKMKRCDDAVSPVIGVMLMLVVTIIIAAVVSTFAGGLANSQESTPAITLDVSIKNSGGWATSYFKADVLSVSEPIDTAKVKLITRWSTTSKEKVEYITPGNTTETRNKGDLISGGATVQSAGNDSNVLGWTGGKFGVNTTYGDGNGTAPWGYGMGVQEPNSGKPNAVSQQFGRYSLIGGTIMKTYPAGQSGGFGVASGTSGYGIETPYVYTDWGYNSTTTVDGMQAVLGQNWEHLRSGDTVNVKMIYIPTGAVIYDRNVVVS